MPTLKLHIKTALIASAVALVLLIVSFLVISANIDPHFRGTLIASNLQFEPGQQTFDFADLARYAPLPYDPSKPLYVKMKTKIFSRMFGEFAPKTGDLVFTKSGELLGMMVNREFCAVINNIRLDSALPIGEPLANLKTGPVLEGLRQRILALAPELQ